MTQLLHVLAGRVPEREFNAIMHEVGRGLMNGDLGGTTEVTDEGDHLLILGHGCPLAAATSKYPEACNALETLLSEFVGQAVIKCCDRYDHQRCCFEVAKERKKQRSSRTR